ncbi:hypothetical protein [Thiocapsa sp.]|uniref:hypothetical protein n=1 Tax=Thiocapsa sp. TaxID=2024551 RepID=UPI003593B3B2
MPDELLQYLGAPGELLASDIGLFQIGQHQLLDGTLFFHGCVSRSRASLSSYSG